MHELCRSRRSYAATERRDQSRASTKQWQDETPSQATYKQPSPGGSTEVPRGLISPRSPSRSTPAGKVHGKVSNQLLSMKSHLGRAALAQLDSRGLCIRTSAFTIKPWVQALHTHTGDSQVEGGWSELSGKDASQTLCEMMKVIVSKQLKGTGENIQLLQLFGPNHTCTYPAGGWPFGPWGPEQITWLISTFPPRGRVLEAGAGGDSPPPH